MSDRQYLEWLRKKPCAICRGYAEYLESGEGRCHAAHVRRSHNSGTGIKPQYSAIPLCFKCHSKQHKHGESSLMPKDEWDSKAKHYFELWKKY